MYILPALIKTVTQRQVCTGKKNRIIVEVRVNKFSAGTLFSYLEIPFYLPFINKTYRLFGFQACLRCERKNENGVI